jgi:hypothetical protein
MESLANVPEMPEIARKLPRKQGVRTFTLGISPTRNEAIPGRILPLWRCSLRVLRDLRVSHGLNLKKVNEILGFSLLESRNTRSTLKPVAEPSAAVSANENSGAFV